MSGSHLAPVIVLEGADGVGKTTLADALELALVARGYGSVKRYSCGPPDGDALSQYWRIVCEAAEAAETGTPSVIDRLHIGELVYGPMFRGGSRIALDDAVVLDHTLASVGAMLIQCTISHDEQVRRLMARDAGRPDRRSGARVEDARAIAAAFKYWCSALGSKWNAVDCSHQPWMLAAELSQQAAFRARFGIGPGWWGHRTPDVVLAVNADMSPEMVMWTLGAMRQAGATKPALAVSRPCTHAAVREMELPLIAPTNVKWSIEAQSTLPVNAYPIISMRRDEDRYSDSPWQLSLRRAIEQINMSRQVVPS